VHDETQDDGRSTPVASRALFRRKGRWPVVLAGDDGEHVAIDLSVGGLFLADVIYYPRGTRLQVTLSLPSGPLRTAATVRWVREQRQGPMMEMGMGLLFDELPDSEKERILDEIQPGRSR
jgi:hypothetical protein